jgi:DNA mismatch endonuclease (patch repair protein)
LSDRIDPARRSRLMKKVATRNTGPELQLRSLLHRLGYRFRLHRKDLPGTPDIVFPARHAVIFVHGCFWHAHGCSKGQLPKSRLEYWGPKLCTNVERDKRNIEMLVAAGWRVAVVWQCDLRDQRSLVARLHQFLEDCSDTSHILCEGT